MQDLTRKVSLVTSWVRIPKLFTLLQRSTEHEPCCTMSSHENWILLDSYAAD